MPSPPKVAEGFANQSGEPPAVGAAQSYIEGVFGGPTTEADEEFSVADTPVRLTVNDPEALALTIVNAGSNTLYVLFDQGVSSTRGIILVSSGGSLSMNVRDDQTLPTREWWAVSNAVGTDVLVIRTRRFALT